MAYVAISPTESQIQTALRTFLLSILPAGTEVVEGQDNEVAEPVGSDFVTMTAIMRERLTTNIDTFNDNTFTGSISGNTLTISSVGSGAVFVGSPVYGATVAAGTYVTAFGAGSGGVGTYTVSISQTVASGLIASGSTAFINQTKLTIQLDVHGPNSPENSQIIGTLFRDEYATDIFAALNANVCPLYADDPKQIPFVNAEQLVEERWVVDCVLQVDQTTIATGQQFMTQVTIPLVPVPSGL